MPKFYVVVTYTNEPYVEYLYFAHDRVLQFEYQSNDGNSIRIPLNEHFLYEDKSEIYRIARQSNVLFIEQEKISAATISHITSTLFNDIIKGSIEME